MHAKREWILLANIFAMVVELEMESEKKNWLMTRDELVGWNGHTTYMKSCMYRPIKSNGLETNGSV
jgi:hypothetical protein